MKNEYSPIALFCYKRLDHLKATFDALEKNSDFSRHQLFIFVDGPKSENDRLAQNSVCEFALSLAKQPNVSCIIRPSNLGLKSSIIAGITHVLSLEDSVIVVEDDILTSSAFLPYMNKCLQTYRTVDHIFSISGYSHSQGKSSRSVYLSRRGSSWGWGTWRDRWNSVNWDREFCKIQLSNRQIRNNFVSGGSDLVEMLNDQINGLVDSWSILFDLNMASQGKFCLYPDISFVQNIGFDGSGVNCHSDPHSIYRNRYLNDNCNLDLPFNISYESNLDINRSIHANNWASFKSRVRRLKRFVKLTFRPRFRHQMLVLEKK